MKIKPVSTKETKKFGLYFGNNDGQPLSISDGPIGIKNMSFSSSGEARVEIRAKAGDLVRQVIRRLRCEPEPTVYARFHILPGTVLRIGEGASNLDHIDEPCEMVVKFAKDSLHLQCWIEVYE